MTTAMAANGPVKRKQLSDQLDRLDTIIDALAEALPEAVADAARDGTRQAVRDAIVEILTNPELRGLVATVTPPAAMTFEPAPPEPAGPIEPRPGFWARARARLSAAKAAVLGAA